MYLLTLKDKRDDGAYAVLNRYGEKVLFMFEEEDDAERYAMMISDEEDNADLNVIEIDDALAITTCKRYNYKYAVITPNDIGWFLTVDLVSNLWKLDRYEEIKEVIEAKIDAADMDPRITAIFAVVEQKAGNKKRAKELIARAKINGLVPDRIKTWLRGQPAAIKLIEQINEIDTF